MFIIFLFAFLKDYGKSMTILKNSQSSTYDLPPLSNGVGSLPRTPKVNSPSAIGLLDYPIKNENPGVHAQSKMQRPLSSNEVGSMYNQPYSPVATLFNPLSPYFSNGAPFQSPKFNYMWVNFFFYLEIA